MTAQRHAGAAKQEEIGGREVSLLWLMPFDAQIRDVIYNYIRYVKGLEDRIIDTWPLQRLRYILQLQAAHFVYPSATHTRFNHSLGVMHIAYRFMDQLLRSLELLDAHLGDTGKYMLRHARELMLAARITGLLHDVGHGPFSHAFDKYVLGNSEFLGYRFGNHEVMGYLIYRDYLRRIIHRVVKESNKGIDADTVIELLDVAMKPPYSMAKYTDLGKKGLLDREDYFQPSPDLAPHMVVRLAVRDFFYPADILDYLKRDSYYTGLPLGEINIDWLILNTYLIPYENLLIPGIEAKAVDDLVRLLNARKFMYKNVYLHHVNLAFIETIGILLGCLKHYIAGIIDRVVDGDLEAYMALTDYSIYGLLQNIMARGDIGAVCGETYRELGRQALKNLLYIRKPAWKLLAKYTINKNDARHIFSRRFKEVIQAAINKQISTELSALLGEKGFRLEDIKVTIISIDVFPSAAEDLFSHILVAKTVAGRIVDRYEIPLDKFAKEHGIIPEAIFLIYINREKYKELSSSEIAAATGLAKEIIDEAIGRSAEEKPPETS